VGKILIIHSGLTGISNACLALADRLQDDNHQVWISAMQNQRAKTEENGLEYLEINPIQIDYQSKEKNLSKLDYFDGLTKKLDFESFEKTLQLYQIDLVLIDMELHEYIVYLSSIRFQFVLLSQWFSIARSKNNLPLYSTRIPQSQFNNKLVWAYSQMRGRLKTILNRVKTRGLNRRNFILHLAKELHFDTTEFISYQFPLPFSYRTLPTLLMTHPDLEFSPHELPNHTSIYPLVQTDRKEVICEEIKSQINHNLSQLSQENKKLILVTRSSMQKSNAQDIPVLIEALKEIPNVISIVSLGDWYQKFKDYSSSNVHLYRRIPQLKLLKHTTLSINHGGIHTINECIHYQVPMLILSGKQFDQNGCAARVDNHGSGVTLSQNQVTKASLISAINKVINTPIYRSRIQELHQSYADAKSNNVLENVINSYLN